MYILSTGCQWRLSSEGFSATTARCITTSSGGSATACWIAFHHALYVECRERAEREASPTAAVIDSQSVKSAEKGGLHRSAWLRCRQADQGQEAAYSGRYTRVCCCTPSSMPPMCRTAMAACCCSPRCLASFHSSRKLFADSAYQGPIFADGSSPKSCPILQEPKSSNDPTAHQVSCSYPSVGSSSVRLLGSTAAAVSPRTGKISTAAVLLS